MRTKKDQVRNRDLWERLLNLCDKHTVTFFWVKGHAGHAENERCDRLSYEAANGRNLAEDAGYDPEFVPRKNKEELAKDAGQQSLFDL